MYSLNNRDYQNILALVHFCNSRWETEESEMAILGALQRMFKTCTAYWLASTPDLKGIDLANIIILDADEYYDIQYVQHYWRYDPSLPAVLHSRKVVFKADDIVPYSRWVKLVYYKEFLRPQRQRHELNICLRSSNRLFGWISLPRLEWQRNFDERDTAIAKVLAPHLTNAVRNRIIFSRIKREKELLQNGAEYLREGIILLDLELSPVYFNSKARTICLSLSHRTTGLTNGIQSEELPLPPEVVQDCLTLKRQSQGSWSRLDPLQHQRIMSTQNGQAYYIEVSVIRQNLHTSSIPYFLVSMECFAETRRLNQGIIAERYHLTKRETDMIFCVADGLTNNEIAEKLFLSKLTVETHLRNIFEKTGVRNRTRLTTLM